MAQSNLKKIKDHTAKPDDAVSVEIDWSAVAAEMSATTVSDSGPLGVRELQDRVASALSAPDAASASEIDAKDGISP